MQKFRIFQVSTFQALCDIFRNPTPPSYGQPSWDVPWNVYQTSDIRAGTVPIFPYVYLIDHDEKDLAIKIPAIVVEMSVHSFALDLGNENWSKLCTITCHCLGGSKAISMDLSSYIEQAIKNIPLYDYNNPIVPGIYPILDTRPAIAGQIPPRYFPVFQVLQVDPSVTQGSFNASKMQKAQGMLTSAEIIQFKMITSL